MVQAKNGCPSEHAPAAAGYALGGWLRNFLGGYIQLMVVAALILTFSRSGHEESFPRMLRRGLEQSPGLFAWLLMLGLIFCLCIALHELGHWAMAMLAGFKFTSLAIGPFMLLKQAQGAQISIQPQA